MNKNTNDNCVDSETKNTYDPSKHCNPKDNKHKNVKAGHSENVSGTSSGNLLNSFKKI